MTVKIRNISQLRDKILEVFEQLYNHEIEIMEASVMAKLSETVISGLKTEMDYARLTNSTPHIPFLTDSVKGQALEIEPVPRKLIGKGK